MKQLSIMILVLALAQIACLQSAIPSAPTAAVTPPATESGSVPSTANTEDPAGAVFWPTEETREPMCATVTASEALHLRAEPSEKGAHLAYLSAGQKVTVRELGAWWKIEADGQTGYANAKYLQEGCK